MASAAPICTCIKTFSNTPTCENCVKSLQSTIRKQHCRLKDASGRSVHNPHKGLWPHTLERGPVVADRPSSIHHSVPLQDCCGYFHLPSQCRFRHNGGSLMFGPKVLTTTCPDAIRQLAVPSDSDEEADEIPAWLFEDQEDQEADQEDLTPFEHEFTM
jgi:hypothetical protein